MDPGKVPRQMTELLLRHGFDLFTLRSKNVQSRSWGSLSGRGYLFNWLTGLLSTISQIDRIILGLCSPILFCFVFCTWPL